MSKHTSGPWKQEKNSPKCVASFDIWGANGILVAYLGHTRVDGEADANARLIAAAPDLLAALKEVVAISDRKHNAWDAAKAAIAKAEGTDQ